MKMSSETRSMVARRLGMMTDIGMDLEVPDDVVEDVMSYVQSMSYYCGVVGTIPEYKRTIGWWLWKRTIVYREGATIISCAYNSELFNLREELRS